MKLRRGAVAAVAAALLLSVSVAQAGTVSVSVVDKETDAPLAKALVVVVSGDAVVAVGQTRDDGAWRATVNATAKISVIATKKLYVTESKTISYDGQGNPRLVFALRRHASDYAERLGRIVGFVRNAQGEPVDVATLVLFKRNAPIGAARPQKATGVYELQWYPPGSYTVLVAAQGYQTAKHPSQQIAAGESLWLDVTLQPK